MPLTNLPQGVTSYGVPLVGGALPIIPENGSYWFVDSVNGSASFPGTFDQPFAALSTAITAAAVNDVIVLAPAHAETISAAGGVTVNKAGLRIFGFGSGSKRPTFTFATSTAATFLISAAGVQVTNIIGTTTVDQIVSPFSVTAAGVSLDIEWQDGSSVLEAVRAVLGNAAADKLRLNLKYIGFPAGSHCVNAVRLVGTNDAVLNVDLYGKASTAWVEFLTTACTNIEVYGYTYNSGTTDGSKNVVDTATGSTWFASISDGAAGASFSGGSGAALASDDISTVAANQAVPTADSTANTLSRDVVGNKTDASVTTVGTTKSLVGYLKGVLTWIGTVTNSGGTATLGAVLGDFANTTLVSKLVVPALDSTANVNAADVAGNKTDTAVYVPGTTKSQTAYLKGHADLQERVALSATAVMVNGNTLFTVAGGPIEVMALVSVCVTANGATASTLQYSATPTIGAGAATISGASASLANAAAGASVTLAGTALATAALLSANGPNLIANPGTIYVPAGTITVVIGVGSTTGTWQHFIRYKPLATGVTVS